MRGIILAFMLIAVDLFGQSVFIHRLKWDAIPEATSGYKVYRSVGTNTVFLTMLSTTNLSVGFTNTAAGFYRYRVTSVNSFGESLPSNERYADMRRPNAPTNMTLSIEIPAQ